MPVSRSPGPDARGGWIEYDGPIDSRLNKTLLGAWLQDRIPLRGGLAIEPGARVDWNSFTGESALRPRFRLTAQATRKYERGEDVPSSGVLMALAKSRVDDQRVSGVSARAGRARDEARQGGVSGICPQHGMRGNKQNNMEESPTYLDPQYGIPVFSVYGEVRRPTADMLDVVSPTYGADPSVRSSPISPTTSFQVRRPVLAERVVDEARGQFAAARGHFERAAGLFPTAQAPGIALSRVAIVEGRGDDAVSSLMAGVGEIAAPSETLGGSISAAATPTRRRA